MLTIPAGARHMRVVDIDTTSATFGKDAIYADVSGTQCSFMVFTVTINKLTVPCPPSVSLPLWACVRL